MNDFIFKTSILQILIGNIFETNLENNLMERIEIKFNYHVCYVLCDPPFLILSIIFISPGFIFVFILDLDRRFNFSEAVFHKIIFYQ